METNNEHKAAVSGAIQTLGPALATSFNAVVDTLGVGIPQAIPVLFAAAYGLFGYYLCFQQEKINAFAEWIRTHPNEFAEHIVTQPSVQAGFLIFLENYLKTRDAEKRLLILRIFNGFATSADMERFELERLLDTVTKLSPEGVGYLRFISSTILPPLREYARSEGLRLQSTTEQGGQTAEWWERAILTKNEPITKRVKQWIYDEYDPNSKKVQKQYGYDGTSREITAKIYAAEEPHDQRLTEMTAEYLSLGVFYTIQGVSGTIGGGSSDEQTFTQFGWKVLSYLEEGETIT